MPVGLFGTVWAYLKLEERSKPQTGAGRLVGQRHVRRSGLILMMVSVTYGIRPYGGHADRLGEPATCSRCSAPGSRRWWRSW